ncbi:MAG: hypothetical protein AAGK17_09400 [Pseudomonadota bacterium]
MRNKAITKKALGLAAAIGVVLSAPSASGRTLETVHLQPGQFKIYTLPASEPMMVGFSVEEATEVAMNCQGWRADPETLKFPHCGGVFESDGRSVTENGMYVTGLYGAGVRFMPKNGKITVALKNISRVPLDLSLYARPID